MADLRLAATVSADGKQATAELKKLVGGVAETKVALDGAKAASAAASAELKKLVGGVAETKVALNEAKAASAAASAELKKLVGGVAETKVALNEAKAASAAASAELKKLDTSVAGASVRAAELRTVLVGAKVAEIEAGTAAAAAARQMDTYRKAQDDAANAGRRVVNSAGQIRAATNNLGQQIGDISQGLAAGINPAVIFGQQAGQVAFAMGGMGGAMGKVGAFLLGPWGIALTAGTVLLSPLVAKLFDSEKASKAAADGMEKFRERQANIANFIDATTGRLTEQNKTLIANAVLTRQAAIEKNNADIKTGTAGAFDAAGRAAKPRTEFVSERHADRQVFDVDVVKVIDAANGSVEKLDAGLRALAARRPDLKGLIREASDAAAKAVLLTRENKASADAIDQLTGKTTTQGKATAGLIEKQVALATATTPLEAARARYNLVLATGAAAEKEGGKALDDYRAKLTAAAVAVNSAETAQKAGTATAHGLNKELRDGARDAKALAAENAGLIASYDPLQQSALNYAKALDEIALAQKRGLIGGVAAANARITASQAQEDVGGKVLRSRLTEGGSTLFADGENYGKSVMDRLSNDAPDLGQKIGKAAGDGFAQNALALSQAIGGNIGGSFGQYLRTSTAISAALEKFSPGQGASFDRAFTNQVKDSFDPLTKLLTDVFREDGKLAMTLGNVLGKTFSGAAIGKQIGESLFGASGGKLGGSIGTLFGLAQSAVAGQKSGVGGALNNGLSAIGAVAPQVGLALAINDLAANILDSLGLKVNKGLFLLSPIAGIIEAIASPTPRAFQNIGTDASGALVTSFGGARGKGKEESLAAAKEMAKAFTDSLEKLVSFTGGTLAAGAALGNLGPANGKYGYGTGTADTNGYVRDGIGQSFDTAQEAVTAGLQSVISRGLLGGISEAVKAALLSSTDIDKAVAEAGKVKSLEAMLAGRRNPFGVVFEALEQQIAERNSVAAKYGFDLVELEKINGEDRAKAVQATLANATGSIKSLLNDLKFGSTATGSISDRLAGLNTERARLVSLSSAGDTSQNDAIATVTQQIDALQKSAFGSTQAFADGRSTSVSILNDLVSQTEARVQKAADDAAKANLATVTKLTEANASLDDQVGLLGISNSLLAQIAAALVGGGGGGRPFELSTVNAR